MKNTPRRGWTRALYLPVLAVGVALVAAVSSWAANPAAAPTPSQGTEPAAQGQLAPVQDTQTTPAPPQSDDRDDRGGAREDCPDGEGGGDGAGSGAGAGAGSGSSPQPDARATTDAGTEV